MEIGIATRTDALEITELINQAYVVEDGDTGVAFKKTPRLLEPYNDGNMR